MSLLIDLLGPLEEDRLKSIFASDRVKARSLTTTFYRFRIPLTPKTGATSYKALQIEPVTLKPEKILVGLLWNAMFGKKFKIVHWFILFQVLSKTLKADNASRAILGILMIITAKAGTSWNTNIGPVRTIVRRVKDSDSDRVINGLLRDLPFRLPEKGPKIDDVIKVSIVQVKMRRPKEAARIGVGYRDKGSLNVGSSYDPLPPDLFEDAEDIFDRLLRQTKKRYRKFI